MGFTHGPVPTSTAATAPNGWILNSPNNAVIDFAADFRCIEDSPGKVVLTDITAPIDQPSTLRLAQQVRPNIYAGSAIESGSRLATSRGCDTVIEIKEVWSVDDNGVTRYVPVRAALTLNLPIDSHVDAGDVEWLVGRVCAAVATQGSTGSLDEGIVELLHGVLAKE